MSTKKYMKMLISIPNETYGTFIQNVPNGQRSQYIVHLLNDNLKPKAIKEIPESPWSRLGMHAKRKYSQKQIKKMIKNAWNNVD